jgi:hypothetical protein
LIIIFFSQKNYHIQQILIITGFPIRDIQRCVWILRQGRLGARRLNGCRADLLVIFKNKIKCFPIGQAPFAGPFFFTLYKLAFISIAVGIGKKSNTIKTTILELTHIFIAIGHGDFTPAIRRAILKFANIGSVVVFLATLTIRPRFYIRALAGG